MVARFSLLGSGFSLLAGGPPYGERRLFRTTYLLRTDIDLVAFDVIYGVLLKPLPFPRAGEAGRKVALATRAGI